MKRLTKYLIFSFAVIILYTIAEFVTSMTTGITHDTLTTCLYAFFGTEVGACCLIRIVGTRGEDQPINEQLDPQDEFSGIEEVIDDTAVYYTDTCG